MIQCDYCGRENPEEAVQCTRCFNPLREEPPVAKLTKAGFGIRLAARILDMIFLAIIAYVIGTAITMWLVITNHTGRLHPNGNYPSHGTGLALKIFTATQ